MKVLVEGSTTVINLTDKDFIAEGGEGRVYGKGKTIYKIYLRANKMIPLAKIDELRNLSSRKNILIPTQVLLDAASKQPIGYTMDWLKDSIPMCKLFTNDFRNRFGIEQQSAVALVERMAEDIHFIHKNRCLLVDGNELNYLVDKTFGTPYFIDTDSYQTASFPATAIMPSIMDYHTKGFNEGSDWFSFACIATQLLVGIHPYKGSHPDFASIPMSQRMTARMKANVSIFNKDTTCNAAVRSFDMIPADYKAWLIDVLDRGKRIAPPTIAGVFATTNVKTAAVATAKQFIFTLLASFSDPIIRYTNDHVITAQGLHRNDGNLKLPLCPMDAEIIRSDIKGKNMLIAVCNERLHVWDIAAGLNQYNNSILAEDKMVVGNSIFTKSGEKLHEIQMADLGDNTMPVIKASYDILPNATKLFNGLAYINMLGKHVLMIPYKNARGQSAMFQRIFEDFAGYQILEAKHENRVTIINASNSKGYVNFIIKHSEDYLAYSMHTEYDVSYAVPNFVTLENGICVRITEDDEIHTFSNRMDKPALDTKRDPAVSFEMKLYRSGMKVLFKKNNVLYHLEMKKTL